MANKRQFRHWDNKTIFQTLQKAIQIKDIIEQQVIENGTQLDSLPLSQIDTDVLYDLTTCYEAMYDRLLEEELITSGYPRAKPTYH